MKTLVIHPSDQTTDFLAPIYQGQDWTVIRDNPSTKILKAQIKSHERIIMLGHGTAAGLIGHKRLIIDSTLVYLLREKVTVCIWCQADLFVQKYGLQGLYTGMIISEYDEAIDWSIYQPHDRDIQESNALFTQALSEAIGLTEGVVEKVLSIYHSPQNPIVQFNQQNIYFKS